MSIFNKKQTSGQNNVLTDNSVPAALPTYGMGLENFITSGYPANKTEIIEAAYQDTATQLDDVIATCDHFSTGDECDPYIDPEIQFMRDSQIGRASCRERV
mgnify:CR=1 FL=1